jgi:cell division septation protein DedD
MLREKVSQAEGLNDIGGGNTRLSKAVAIVASVVVLGAVVVAVVMLDKEVYRQDAQIADMQKNVRTGMKGYKARQESAPRERPAVVRKRIEAPQPVTVQAVKPAEQQAAVPVTEQDPPKTEVPGLPPLELIALKPPAAGQARTPQFIVPGKIIGKSDKEAEIVASASSERPPAPEMLPGGTFAVNLASFRQKQKADQYVEELKKLGIHAYRWEVNLPEKGRWYRVSIGGFLTLKEAENYTRHLRQQGISDMYISKIAESS